MNRKQMLARLKLGEDPLELSILKWRDIVDGKGKDLLGSNCALCEASPTCQDCIIEQKVAGCGNTPYYEYLFMKEGEARDKLAKAELEFLKSLRKEATP